MSVIESSNMGYLILGTTKTGKTKSLCLETLLQLKPCVAMVDKPKGCKVKPVSKPKHKAQLLNLALTECCAYGVNNESI